MNLLNLLGITPEEQAEFDRKEKARIEATDAFYDKWKEWSNKNMPFIHAYQWLDKLLPVITEPTHDNVLIIKGTKKNLNEIIQFSSSRYNDYKKSDFVGWCYDYIRNADQTVPLEKTGEAITGCFSAGAHGHGGKKGSARFNAKFLNSGKYQFVVPFGMPVLILNDSLYVIFEGFDYKDVHRDAKILSDYEHYKKELSEIEQPPF